MSHHSLLDSLSFKKLGSQIVERAKALGDELKAKTERKTAEMKSLCDEYKITVADVFANLDSMRGYTNSGMPSEEMAKLQKLSSDIDHHRKEMERLGLIERNLTPNSEFTLTFEELQYFKF